MLGDTLERVTELIEARANLEAARRILQDVLDAQGEVGPFRQAVERLARIEAEVARVEAVANRGGEP